MIDPVLVDRSAQALVSAINAFCRRCKDDSGFLHRVRNCQDDSCPLHPVRSGAEAAELKRYRRRVVDELTVVAANADVQRAPAEHDWTDHEDRLLLGWREERPKRTWKWIGFQLRRPVPAIKRRWSHLNRISNPPHPLARLELK